MSTLHPDKYRILKNFKCRGNQNKYRGINLSIGQYITEDMIWAAGYEPSRLTGTYIEKINNDINEEFIDLEKKYLIDRESKIIPEQKKTTTTQEFIWDQNNYYALDTRPARFLPARYAHDLIEHSNYHFITLEGSDEIYYYSKGIYKAGGKEKIHDLTRTFFQSTQNKHMLTEIIDHVRAQTRTKKNTFDQDKDLICFENGVYSISKKILSPLSPSFKLTKIIPVEYDPSKDCPNFKKYIQEVLHKEDISVMQEAFGYTLCNEHLFRSAFMFKGAGGNGKSIMLKVLTMLLGRENVSNVPLADLGDNRFAMARLAGKKANIFSDLPKKALLDVGKFKALTGNDVLEGEKKGIQEWIDLGIPPKQFYSTNELPQVSDHSDAFWERWIVLEFPNTFSVEQRNTGLFDTLVTMDELSGILNWSLDGLNRLLKNNGFSYSRSRDEVMRQWINETDPVKSFINNCLEHDSTYSHELLKSDLYELQLEYCRDNGYEYFSEMGFFKLFHQKVGWRVIESRRGVNGKERVFRGILVKSKSLISSNFDVFPIPLKATTNLTNLILNPERYRGTIDTTNMPMFADGVEKKLVKLVVKNFERDEISDGTFNSYIVTIIKEVCGMTPKGDFTHQDLYKTCDLNKVTKEQIDSWIEYQISKGTIQERANNHYAVIDYANM